MCIPYKKKVGVQCTILFVLLLKYYSFLRINILLSILGEPVTPPLGASLEKRLLYNKNENVLSTKYYTNDTFDETKLIDKHKRNSGAPCSVVGNDYNSLRPSKIVNSSDHSAILSVLSGIATNGWIESTYFGL